MVCVIGMLISWRSGRSDIGRILTYCASSAYVAVAFMSGAHRSSFGRLVLCGVACCWIGDIVGPKNFLAGAGAFLIGHIFFIPAFIVRGVTRKGLLAGFVLYATVSGIALSIIGPKIPAEEQPLIIVYKIGRAHV